jgi:hypothetical protein
MLTLLSLSLSACKPAQIQYLESRMIHCRLQPGLLPREGESDPNTYASETTPKPLSATVLQRVNDSSASAAGSL